jgi:hypothetical protein
VCPSSFIDRRRVRQVPNALPRSKALKHGHSRVRTSSIGADRGNDGIWIYELAGSITINRGQMASRGISSLTHHRRFPRLSRPAATSMVIINTSSLEACMLLRYISQSLHYRIYKIQSTTSSQFRRRPERRLWRSVRCKRIFVSHVASEESPRSPALRPRASFVNLSTVAASERIPVCCVSPSPAAEYFIR